MLLIPIFTGARLDGERCIRHVNTEPFLLFTYVIRLKIDVQACLGLKRIHAVLNLTRSLFCCCWASCENWHKYANEIDMMCCRIWSWSRMPCGKHGPRAKFFTRHGGPWSNHIIARSLIEFAFHFVHRNLNFSTLKWTICGSHRGC